MKQIKEKVLTIIEKLDFNEYLEEKSSCPECKEKSLIRHIQKEDQQKWKGRWYVEHCNGEECEYWNCGFLTKKYKPQKDEEYRKVK